MTNHPLDLLGKGDTIEHLCLMSHTCIDGYLYSMSADDGYIDRLTQVALSGGFLGKQTTEAIRLRNDAKYLRAIAEQLEGLEAKLTANEPVNILVAG